MSREYRVTAHVTEATKDELERKRREEGMSMSSYVNQLILRQLRMEAGDEVASEIRATEQLQRTIDEGTRQLRDVADDIRAVNAKTGVYAIAGFELMKRDFDEGVVDGAISTGARRLRADETDEDETHETATDGNDYDPFGWRDDEGE